MIRNTGAQCRMQLNAVRCCVQYTILAGSRACLNTCCKFIEIQNVAEVQMRSARIGMMIVLVAALCGSILGCGDSSKTPSKENFEKVVKDYLNSSPRTFTHRLPMSGGMWLVSENERPEILKAMKSVGLLTEIGGPAIYGSTPEGAKFLQKGEFDDLYLVTGISDPSSVQIIRFSEPAPVMGKKICEVEYSYTWKPASFMSIDKYAPVRAIIEKSGVQKNMATRGSSKMIVMLYDDGWHPAK